MPTLIMLSGGEKVTVAESPEEVVGQLKGQGPTRFNRADGKEGVWINPAAVVYFYEPGVPFVA